MVEDEADSWEELVDENGQSLGMKIRSFRLNVLNGSTESIDEDTDNVRRACGLADRTNYRWDAVTGVEVEGETAEYEYLADVSGSSTEEECWGIRDPEGGKEYEVPVEGTGIMNDAMNDGYSTEVEWLGTRDSV